MLRGGNWLLRWLFLTGLILVLLKVCYDLLSQPAVVTTAGSEGFIYLALMGVIFGIYGSFVFYLTRTQTLAEQTNDRRIVLRYGAIMGLLCGGALILEILVADVWGAGLGSLHHLLYYGSALMAAFLPGLTGLLAAWRTGRMISGLQAGVLAGMCGGLVLFLTVSAPLSILLINAGQQDPQSMSEFQRSGLPDMQTFLVGDYLAAMIAHLWIGLVTGLVLGGIGGAFGRAVKP